MNVLDKVYWPDIKKDIQSVNPSLYALLSELNPSHSLPFYKARYDFGEHFGIRNHAYLPSHDGSLKKIDSNETENDIYQDLGYGKDSLPLGMILDKHCEWHHISDEGYFYPELTQGPGAIFNMHIIFDEQRTVKNNFMSCSSGALSAFLLPNIGCKRKHQKIQKRSQVSAIAPKHYHEHPKLFKTLLHSHHVKTDWQSTILYFSESFVNAVRHDESWIKLKLFFSEALRAKQNRNMFDPATLDLFLSSECVNRYRPPPFIIDTCKYLFNICMGKGIARIPATDESYLPLKDIQKIYHEQYELSYTPTVMVPAALSSKTQSVYYSLQHPMTKINTFKTNISNSTLSELEMLQHVYLAYRNTFLDNQNHCYGSELFEACQQTEVAFFHYKAMPHTHILPSNLIQDDSRFRFSYFGERDFPYDAKLFRGCIQLSRQ